MGAPPSHNEPRLWISAAPRPDLDAHKYQRGHCLVVSGPELQTGASRLAAIAALNAGAGAVTIAGKRDALLVHASQVTAIMLREAASADALATLVRQAGFHAAIIGPAAGPGASTLASIVALLGTGLPLVLDADALTSLVGQLPVIAARVRQQPVVLTPHAGEFGRLFGDILPEDPHFRALSPKLQSSKAEQARAAARLSQAVVVFKGRETIIAAPDGRAALNDNAGPEFATAGSGDVLAGLIGSHMAQGMPPFEAAAAGVWLHATCGADYGVGLTADRLVGLVRPLAAHVLLE